MEFIVILLILFIGSLIQGASGFGFGLISMGLLPVFLPLKNSTLLVVFLVSIISLEVVRKYYRYIQWQTMTIVLTSALIGRVFSFFVLDTFGEMLILKKILGFLLIGMVFAHFMATKRETHRRFANHPLFAILLTGLGGFIGGVFAVGGPFFVFYFLMHNPDKRNYIANLQTTFLVTNSFTLLLHGLNGDFHSFHFSYMLTGAFIVLLGVKLGLRWFYHLPSEKIQKLASGIIIISAFNLLLF